ncbi:MAG: zinc ribbon domain-containing protein [Candidatus Limnocylindrales bacterium]
MIRCTKCETINPKDAVLCSNCSSLLEWTGVTVDPPEPEPKRAGVEPEGSPLPDPAVTSHPAEANAAEPAAAEQRAADEERLAAEAKAAADETRLAEAKAAEVARLEAEAKAAEETRLAAEAKAAEEAAAEQRRAQDGRLAAEARAAEETRLAAESKAAEEQADRQAPLKPEADNTEQDSAEDRRLADEESRLAAEAKATEQRAADDARLAAEARAADDARLAAEARAADEGQPPAVRPGKRSDQPALFQPTPADPDEDDQPESRKPTVNLPSHPRPMPEPPPPPEPLEAAPGDIICRSCGTPNAPTRTFCRKCGKPLAAEAPAPLPVPWYRRLFARQPGTNQAGERPKRLGEAGQPRSGPIRRVLPFVLILLIAFGATSVLISPGVRDFLGSFVTDLRLRLLPEISDVHPVSAQGAGVGANTGKLALDNNTATFWLANPASGDPTVTAGLEQTINLGGLVFHSGSTAEAAFTSHRRPKTVELTFPGTDRPPVQVVLKDVADPQPVAVDVRGVKTVVFRIVDWFESAAGGDKLVALREIELKERR